MNVSTFQKCQVTNTTHEDVTGFGLNLVRTSAVTRTKWLTFSDDQELDSESTWIYTVSQKIPDKFLGQF